MLGIHWNTVSMLRLRLVVVRSFGRGDGGYT